MGTGKSAVGRALARRLKRPFVDLDAVIERAAGRSVAEVFAWTIVLMVVLLLVQSAITYVERRLLRWRA